MNQIKNVAVTSIIAMSVLSSTVLLSSALFSDLGFAAINGLKPSDINTAGARKTGGYIKDGLFIGGDRAINEVVVLDLRFAKKNGFERLVLDLEGSHDGEPAAIARPPYFHVNVTPAMQRLEVTLWGSPQLAFDSSKVLSAMKKSSLIKGTTLLPLLDKDRWTFSLALKDNYAVEVFELKNPVRVIIDIKSRK